MTLRAVPRPRRRAGSPAPMPDVTPDPSLAIGEINQTVFDCPNCSRPLAMGARRCPGCGTRLIIGVPLVKASLLTALGLTIGLFAGAAGGAAFGLSHASVATLAPLVAAQSAEPLGATGTDTSGTGGTSAVGSGSRRSGGSISGVPVMPMAAQAALMQVIGINDHLAAASTELAAALHATSFDASSVAQTLRVLSADTLYGQDLAGKVSSWPGSTAVGSDLSVLYASIHATAAQGLVASVQNESAYRSSARAMLRLLSGLPTVDSRLRAVAAANGVSLADPSSAP